VNKERKNIGILIIENNPADVRLIQETLTDGRLNQKFSVFGDGESAIGYLRKLDAKDLVSRPDLVFLDLNLPGRNGLDVLEEIKSNPVLWCIPVVVLSSSNSEDRIAKSYRLNANAYITKPNDYTEYADILRTVSDFWLNTVSLPRPQNDIY
jgi:chemotaxis family two-component system response regulator Rcp1